MTVTLITGINSGMGFATAKSLLQQGHAIIGTVRDQERSTAEIRQLDHLADGNLTVYEMNLASLKSVQHCAEQIGTAHRQIDICIFNAGIMTPPYAITEDGFESQFQVNYLSHYYLFRLLKDSLLNSATKKVISISSSSSEKGLNHSISDFERDIHGVASTYDAMKCYRESKLAQVLFTRELHNRFSDLGLKSYAVHPGVVNTNLFYRQYHALTKAFIQPVAWLGYATGFLRTPEQGASTAIYLATQPIQDGGRYWADKKIRPHNPIADDNAFLTEFWDWSTSILEEMGDAR